MNNIDAMPPSEHISFNPANCTGCNCCELACSSAHFGVYSNKLSSIRIKADFQFRKFDAYFCRQCFSASCVAACNLGAIKFDESTGARYIDENLCVNCRLCIKACPFSDQTFAPIRIVTFNDEKFTIKCDLCHGIEGGPACVAICPRGALTIVPSKKKNRKEKVING